MSKYGGLPDIDTAPDVYETHPPEKIQSGLCDAPASPLDLEAATEADADGAIDRSSVNPAEAHARFRDAAPKAYSTRPGMQRDDTYDLQGTAAEAESPLARLWRLQSEARELEAQLTQSATAPKAPSASSMLAQVQALQHSLGHMDTAAQVADPWHVSHTLIEALGTNTEAPGTPTSASASAGTGARGYAPWEARVAALERRLGTDVTDTRVPLLATVRKLEAQLALLAHPAHLEAILARATLLASELQQVDTRRQTLATRTDEATVQKIDELYGLQARIEPLVPLAPALLARLQSLAPVHAAAASFASRLEQLAHEQSQMQAQQAELQSLLERVSSSLQDNAAITQRNLAQLQARLDAIQTRISPP
ncbi:hypothetical protein MNAN1_000231 [Malassezia nana]|uniref:Dynactin subunit 2 n=1 Tax=Malassezia nana TaxID=180528 RepID=A0AAF0EGV2_9BASI|nr:hypothetical protein MNAN1_000231 [Malassezia nana]